MEKVNLTIHIDDWFEDDGHLEEPYPLGPDQEEIHAMRGVVDALHTQGTILKIWYRMDADDQFLKLLVEPDWTAQYIGYDDWCHMEKNVSAKECR
jgi:hypothetical protein